MMAMNIVIAGNVGRNVGRLQSVLSPPSMSLFMHQHVERILKHRASERFDREGDDAVGPWAPLAPATIAIRLSSGYGAGPINVRTGDLANYIENTPAMVSADPRGATLTMPGRPARGKLEKKFRGAQQGEFPAPPRPVLAMNMTDTAQTMTALEAYIRVGVGL